MRSKDFFCLIIGFLCFYSLSVLAQNEDVYDTNNYNPSVADGNIVIDDTQITSDVKQVVHPTFNQIKVSSQQGIVELSGSVNSPSDANQLVKMAESVRGVHGIDTSELTIRGVTNPLPDQMITAKVKGLLLREELSGNPGSSNHIKVKTMNGVVYLSGTAVNSHQANEAEDLAESVSGIKDVKSTITFSQ
ncbi:MAG TPA: BON domain-containing protein [Gammaproteobacteria bacterium]|nr:BON domain-containing protein [Gammaproteobacteria bacterium]